MCVYIYIYIFVFLFTYTLTFLWQVKNMYKMKKKHMNNNVTLFILGALGHASPFSAM